MPGSKRNHYLAVLSVFLVGVALIAGMAGCGPFQYNLTISSTQGGEVTTPGEATFTYDEGMVVNLTAEAVEGYRFIEWTGDVGTIADVNEATTSITMSGNYSIMANFGCNPMVAAGWKHTVGLKSDGTVVAVGWNESEQCDVGGWTDITQVAAGGVFTVGFSSNGTLVCVGGGQSGVRDWKDIIQIAIGIDHTVGVNSNGTAVALGQNYHLEWIDDYWKENTWVWDGRCEVGNWTDIIQVAAGDYHTVGLKTDGTVVAVGWNNYGQCDVGNWTDIIQVTAGEMHTVGLKANGTVVAVGHNGSGECDVGNWTDVTQIAAGWRHTVGVRSDGTVVVVGWNGWGQCDVIGWTDIAQVATGFAHTVGLKSDGTVLAAGLSGSGQCNVGSWDLIP